MTKCGICGAHMDAFPARGTCPDLRFYYCLKCDRNPVSK